MLTPSFVWSIAVCMQVQQLISKSFMKRSSSLPPDRLGVLKQSPTRLTGHAGSPQISPKLSSRVQRPHSPVDDNASTGSSSVPEELSVRTPLLELDTPSTTIKTNTSIKVLNACLGITRVFLLCMYVQYVCTRYLGYR